MFHRKLVLALALVLWQGGVRAQMNHHHAVSEAACETTELRCATKVTPAFSQDGTLWLAWMAGNRRRSSARAGPDVLQLLEQQLSAARDGAVRVDDPHRPRDDRYRRLLRVIAVHRHT